MSAHFVPPPLPPQMNGFYTKDRIRVGVDPICYQWLGDKSAIVQVLCHCGPPPGMILGFSRIWRIFMVKLSGFFEL